MSEIPKRPEAHDDLCVWWDNVGNETLDYACTCGVSHRWAIHERAVSVAAVRALKYIKHIVEDPDNQPPCYEFKVANRALQDIEASGWKE